MDNLDMISKLLDGRIVLGNKEEISQNLYIIPVYKVKISFFDLSTELKNNTGDGSSGSMSVVPLCLLQIVDDEIKIISLEKNRQEGIDRVFPNIFSNLDINSILKNIKIDV